MRGYTSLSSSPTTNYMRFDDNSVGGGGGGGRGRSKGGGIVGSPGSLGGLGDNIGFKRFETYISNEAQQKREINQKSGKTTIYTQLKILFKSVTPITVTVIVTVTMNRLLQVKLFIKPLLYHFIFVLWILLY